MNNEILKDISKQKIIFVFKVSIPILYFLNREVNKYKINFKTWHNIHKLN